MKKFIVKTLVLASVIIGMFTNTALASVEQPISFLQHDPQWGDKPFTITRNKYQDMSSSGCGPTAAAMVVHYYSDDEITPVEIADYTVENGYRTRNEGTAHGLFGSLAEKYDIEFYETYSDSEALNWMENKEDPLIICAMGPGNWTRNGHYILLWKIDNGTVYINDPGSTENNRTENTFKRLSSQARKYFCFNRKPTIDIKIFKDNDTMKIVKEVVMFPEQTTQSVSFMSMLEDINVIKEEKRCRSSNINF